MRLSRHRRPMLHPGSTDSRCHRPPGPAAAARRGQVSSSAPAAAITAAENTAVAGRTLSCATVMSRAVTNAKYPAMIAVPDMRPSPVRGRPARARAWSGPRTMRSPARPAPNAGPAANPAAWALEAPSRRASIQRQRSALVSGVRHDSSRSGHRARAPWVTAMDAARITREQGHAGHAKSRLPDHQGGRRATCGSPAAGGGASPDGQRCFCGRLSFPAPLMPSLGASGIRSWGCPD